MKALSFFVFLNIFGFSLDPNSDCIEHSHRCYTLDLIFTDSSVIIKDYPIILNPAIRESEDFEPSDTLNRDTLVVYGSKYTIDGLTLRQTDYSGAYLWRCACLIEDRNTKFFVLVFIDLHQMGTAQQAMYLIFKTDNNNAVFHASYVENLNYPKSKIRIVRKKNGIFLKSKNIDICSWL